MPRLYDTSRTITIPAETDRLRAQLQRPTTVDPCTCKPVEVLWLQGRAQFDTEFPPGDGVAPPLATYGDTDTITWTVSGPLNADGLAPINTEGRNFLARADILEIQGELCSDRPDWRATWLPANPGDPSADLAAPQVHLVDRGVLVTPRIEQANTFDAAVFPATPDAFIMFGAPGVLELSVTICNKSFGPYFVVITEAPDYGYA